MFSQHNYTLKQGLHGSTFKFYNGNNCFFFCSVVYVMVPKEENRTTVVLNVLQLTVEL